jgi:DNA-binding protein HU-beta
VTAFNPEALMNKTDLIGRLAERMDGDRKTAQAAVENVIDLIQRAVHSGDHVSISGFGVFEKRDRAPRTARNPRTGQAVPVEPTTVPSFRPGKYFKEVVAGSIALPQASPVPLTARAAAAAARPPSRATSRSAARNAAAAPRAGDGAPGLSVVEPENGRVGKGARKATSSHADADQKTDHKADHKKPAKVTAKHAPGEKKPAAKSAKGSGKHGKK